MTCIRSCRRSKSLRPRSSSTTISPSRMAWRAFRRSGKTSSSGYCLLMMRPVRERNSTLPSVTQASDRTPSHLISNSQSGSEKGWSSETASMGSSFEGILTFRLPSSSSGRIGCGVRLGGEFSAISSSERPVSTEPSCSSMFHFASAYASLCLIKSHSLPFSLWRNLTSAKLPRNFSPRRLNLSSPRANCSPAGPLPATSYVPRSQTITAPAP